MLKYHNIWKYMEGVPHQGKNKTTMQGEALQIAKLLITGLTGVYRVYS